MPRASQYKQGTLEKIKTAQGWCWYLRYTEVTSAGTSRPRVRIGLASEFPTKSAASRAAESIRRKINSAGVAYKTFGDLLDRYIAEEIPPRHSTRRGYQSMINKHIRPKWGKTAIADVRAYEVRAWLMGLACDSRRKGHVHGLMRVLFRFAMLWEWLPAVENPMRLFSLPGATKRRKQPGTLTHKQFHELLEKVPAEPYRTMIVAAQCTGIRISELLGLQWKDFDFLGGTVKIERGIVEAHVDDTKTNYSKGRLPLHPYLVQLFLAWRSETEFKADEDFVFASPWQAGEKPYNGGKIQSVLLRKIGKEIGLEFSLGWHTFRHTYRALLRKADAPMDVQRDLMRHADIQTTMQTYGGTELDELRPANSRVIDALFEGRKQ